MACVAHIPFFNKETYIAKCTFLEMIPFAIATNRIHQCDAHSLGKLYTWSCSMYCMNKKENKLSTLVMGNQMMTSYADQNYRLIRIYYDNGAYGKISSSHTLYIFFPCNLLLVAVLCAMFCLPNTRIYNFFSSTLLFYFSTRRNIYDPKIACMHI